MEQSTLDTAMDTTTPAPAEESPAATGDVETPAPIDAATAEAATEASAETTQSAPTETAVAAEPATESDAPKPYAPQRELSESLTGTETPESERREVEGGREYEIIFITRADNAEATENTMKSARALIEEAGGAIDNVRVSEVRRLAYTIKREIEGVYTVVNTRFAQSHLPEIDRFFKLEESVLRHMILRDEI